MKNDFLKVEYGCPASNLTQEMAPWHTAFNTALNNLTQQWIEVMTAAIEQGKQNGYVRDDINPNQATLFIMSGYWAFVISAN